MCKHCGTTRENYGYCVKCGKEICEDCASPIDREVHSKCIQPMRSLSPSCMPTDVDPGVKGDPCGFKGDPGIR